MSVVAPVSPGVIEYQPPVPANNENFSRKEEIRITAYFIERLKVLEEYRSGQRTGTLSMENYRIAMQIIGDIETHIPMIQNQWALNFIPSQKKQFKKLNEQKGLLRLQCQAMKAFFSKVHSQAVLEEKEDSSGKEVGKEEATRLGAFLEKTYLKGLAARHIHRLGPEELKFLESAIRDVGQVEERQASRDYRKYKTALNRHLGLRERVRNEIGEKALQFPHPDDTIRGKAKETYNEIIDRYPNFIPILLEGPRVQELFLKQVVHSELSLEVFFSHPLISDFLRSCEYIEKSVFTAGERIVIGEESQLPEIKFKGTFIPIKDLPGYADRTFKNLFGWATLGLDYRRNPHSLKEAIEEREYENGYCYMKDRGLVPINPRTWGVRGEDEEWKYVDIEAENWISQLHPFREFDCLLDRDDAEDEGWRLIPSIKSSERGTQVAGIHSFQGVMIPHENQLRVPEGKVRASYHSFGPFPYLYKGDSNALRDMKLEVLSVDQNRLKAERGELSRAFVVNRKNAMKALEALRNLRRLSLREGYGGDKRSFGFFSTNCTFHVVQVMRAGGINIPSFVVMDSALESTAKKCGLEFLRILFCCFIPCLYFLGARGDNLQGGVRTAISPCLLKKWIQLENESDQLSELLKRNLECEGLPSPSH